MGLRRGMAVAAAALAVTPGLAANEDADFLNFLAGDYIIVGRAPNGDLAYSGRATIEVTNGGVLLRAYRGDTKIKATGGLDVASPEGRTRTALPHRQAGRDGYDLSRLDRSR